MFFLHKPKEPMSLEQVWQEFGTKIEHLCLSMLGREGAQDARQEVALAIPSALERFQGRAKLSTYIYALTRTICLRQLQKSYRWDQKHDPAPLELLVQEEDDPEITLLRKGIAQLEEKFRTPLLLVLIEGYSVAEVAEMLDEAEGTLKTRIRAAKEKLARWMSHQGEIT